MDAELISQMTDAVANYDAKAVIKALAIVLGMSAEMAADEGDWPKHGTHNHYASSLEDLIAIGEPSEAP